jgi:hypothetical protein
VHILRPGVLEALEMRSLVQLFPLMGAPPIPVEGVRQRIVGGVRQRTTPMKGCVRELSARI